MVATVITSAPLRTDYTVCSHGSGVAVPKRGWNGFKKS